ILGKLFFINKVVSSKLNGFNSISRYLSGRQRDSFRYVLDVAIKWHPSGISIFKRSSIKLFSPQFWAAVTLLSAASIMNTREARGFLFLNISTPFSILLINSVK